MMKTGAKRTLALAGSAVVLSLALSGCSVLNGVLGGGNDAPRDEDDQVIEETSIDVFALKVGDCMPAATSVACCTCSAGRS